jgi:hypothetical protein
LKYLLASREVSIRFRNGQLDGQPEALPYVGPAVIVFQFQSSTKRIKVSSDFEHRLVGPYSAACDNGTDSKSHLGLIPVTQFPCASESIHAYRYSTNLLHLFDLPFS